jgi:hypothetical protein
VGESKISLPIAVEALWLVPSLRFPSLRRIWPARKVPLADPEAVLEPLPPPVSEPRLEATAPAARDPRAMAAMGSPGGPDQARTSPANR